MAFTPTNAWKNQDMTPQNMPLWQKNSFELKAWVPEISYLPKSRASPKNLSIPYPGATLIFSSGRHKKISKTPRHCHKLSSFPSILLRVPLSIFSKSHLLSIKFPFPRLPLPYVVKRSQILTIFVSYLSLDTPTCEHMLIINFSVFSLNCLLSV